MSDIQATEPPKRRWFRFRLRTMLVVVTIVCAWLGWSLRQLHQREIVRQFVLANRGKIESGAPSRPWKSLPLSWRILGEQPVSLIDLRGRPSYFTDEDRSYIQSYFPEAEIWLSRNRPQ